MGVYCCGKPLNVWYQPAPHRRTPNLKHWGTSPMCSLLPISMPMYPPVITRGNGRSPIHRGFFPLKSPVIVFFSNIFSIFSMIFPWKPPFAVGFPLIFPWFSPFNTSIDHRSLGLPNGLLLEEAPSVRCVEGDLHWTEENAPRWSVLWIPSQFLKQPHSMIYWVNPYWSVFIIRSIDVYWIYCKWL